MVINKLYLVEEEYEGQVCMLRGLFLNPRDREGQKDEQKPSVTVYDGWAVLKLAKSNPAPFWNILEI